MLIEIGYKIILVEKKKVEKKFFFIQPEIHMKWQNLLDLVDYM